MLLCCFSSNEQRDMGLGYWMSYSGAGMYLKIPRTRNSVLNLVGTILKNETLSRHCSKIWLEHVPMSPYVRASLSYYSTSYLESLQNCDQSKLNVWKNCLMHIKKRFDSTCVRILFRSPTLKGHSFSAPWAMMINSSSFESTKPYLLWHYSKTSTFLL